MRAGVQPMTYPKMLTVAAQVGDGIALGTLLSAEYVHSVVRSTLRRAAELADRDPDQLDILMAGFVAVDDDRDRARDAVRRAICNLYHPLPHPYYDFLLREHGFSAVADTCRHHAQHGRLQTAMDGIDDDVVDSLAVTGTPTQCRQQALRWDGLVNEVIYTNAAVPALRTDNRRPVLDTYRSILAIGTT